MHKLHIMSYLKHLEQQLQYLESVKSESILAAEQEYFKSVALVGLEKEKQNLKNKQNFDREIALVEQKYPTTTNLPADKEAQKKKKVEINYAKTTYYYQELRIEEESKTKITEIVTTLNQLLEKIEDEHNKKKISKKKLYESVIKKIEKEHSITNKIRRDKEKEINQDYYNKSRKLHQGATKTHNELGWHLSELMSTGIYLGSYRILAKNLGLSGITDDVGTFVSKTSVYNNVTPMITYLTLFKELKENYKRKNLNGLINDFSRPKSECSANLIQVLKELELKDSDVMSEDYVPKYDSIWYKLFTKHIKSNAEFRNHVYSVMAKYNQRLAQMHGWEAMPLTKIHLGNCGDINESPFNQTPWHAIFEEYKNMQSVICREYYKQEDNLKKERDTQLLKAQRIFHATIEKAEKSIIEILKDDKINNDLDIDHFPNVSSEQSLNEETVCKANSIQKIKKSLSKKHNSQRLFSEYKKTYLHTIYENAEEELKQDVLIDENLIDDPEICGIFNI